MDTKDFQQAFYCPSCDRVLIPEPNDCGTGYGYSGDDWSPMNRRCYDCCGSDDLEFMRLAKPGDRFTFYLTLSGDSSGTLIPSRVTNWSGTLSIALSRFGWNTWRKSKHAAFSRYVDRYDVWFTGPNGHVWHGVNRGDNQILRCRCLKEQRTLPLPDDRFLVPSRLRHVDTEDRVRLAFCLRVLCRDGLRDIARGMLYRLHSQGGYPYRDDRPNRFAVG